MDDKIKSNDYYWQKSLRQYRVSKRIRKLRKKKLSYHDLAELTGVSRQLWRNVTELCISPGKEFIEMLEKLEGEL